MKTFDEIGKMIIDGEVARADEALKKQLAARSPKRNFASASLNRKKS